MPASLVRNRISPTTCGRRSWKSLIPKHLQKQVEAENLNIVGQPNITDVHFHAGEPLTFKAEFEVVPQIELKEYKDVEVPYHDPEVTDEDVEKRIAEIREQKAQHVNIDPRPIEDGDLAVVGLESLSGVEGEPVKTEEMVLEIGGADTFAAFSENLRGLTPGDEKDFEVSYPEDYGSPKLAGKTVRFHATVKGLRKKELPEVNDDFAQDLGDFRNLEELREALRKAIFAQRAVRGPAGSQEPDRRKTGGGSRLPGPRSVYRAADSPPHRIELAVHGGAGCRSAIDQDRLG